MRREAKANGNQGTYTILFYFILFYFFNIFHFNAEFQRKARRGKKAFLTEQSKEIKETIKWGRLEISSRKLKIPREYFMQRWAQ